MPVNIPAPNKNILKLIAINIQRSVLVIINVVEYVKSSERVFRLVVINEINETP